MTSSERASVRARGRAGGRVGGCGCLHATRASDQHVHTVHSRCANHACKCEHVAQARMWYRPKRAQSRCRCGRGEPSPGADVAGASPVPVRCGRAEPSPGADVACMKYRPQWGRDMFGGAGPRVHQHRIGDEESSQRCVPAFTPDRDAPQLSPLRAAAQRVTIAVHQIRGTTARRRNPRRIPRVPSGTLEYPEHTPMGRGLAHRRSTNGSKQRAAITRVSLSARSRACERQTRHRF